MPEPIELWWARRQRSRGADVPYRVGQYRAAWASFPVLVRQYHPEFNAGIVLSQVPPAADVFLTWQCDAGHRFVATPSEQRSRPGRERRRSSWCPDCAELANPRTPVIPMREVAGVASVVVHPEESPRSPRGLAPGAAPAWVPGLGRAMPSGLMPAVPLRVSRSVSRPVSPGLPPAAPRAVLADSMRRPSTPRLCPKTPRLPVGEPFASTCAPPTASTVEGQLRADLAARLDFTPGFNAIRLGRPFFDHLEAWPDIVLSDLRVAIEFDSTGRYGLEHVGKREEADRRKDRAVRGAGWEVIRIRTGRLPALGPHDIVASGPSRKTLDRLIDELREIRGSLLVEAYLRE